MPSYFLPLALLALGVPMPQQNQTLLGVIILVKRDRKGA